VTARPPLHNLPDPELVHLAKTLSRQIQKWAPNEGLNTTSIAGLDLFRANSTNSCMGSSIYDPSLCLIAQGAKTIWLGDRELDYGPLSCLVSSVHLPVLGKITQASPEQPYLGLKLTIDPQEVTDLMLELGDAILHMEDHPECAESACGLGRVQAEKSQVEAMLRLLKLLDTPADAPILAPLARREILYRALTGEIGPRLRKLAVADSQVHRVSKVISVLKDRFSEPLRVRELADMANMSESALYHSFKQVTRMSPLQFQKKLRLHEARRLMVAQGLEAATASFRVGYESPSHFSREYSRLFGNPPRADVVKLRGEYPETARA